jgi:predicted amidophosphoribosyltransferase
MTRRHFTCWKCGALNYGEQTACLRCHAPAEAGESPAANLCPQCRTPIIKGGRFCLKCGARLDRPAPQAVLICPSCGNQLPAGKKFCNRCGTRVQA